LTLSYDSVILQFVSPWTIAELTERVAAALADRDAVRTIGRIRADPRRARDPLLHHARPARSPDPDAVAPRCTGRATWPSWWRSSASQAARRALAEIQRTLPTLDDAALAALAGVEVARPRPAARAEFWRAPPRDACPPPPSPPPSPAAAASALALRVELELGGGLRLSLTPDRPLTDADVAALHAAAAPLIAELTRRHLVTPPEASP
jgi:hypothetical protein